jgi:dimeric dUTPase (all-alpha-NTP-PPase superfamily)
MNLTKLFAAQKELMERIEKEHPAASGEDRFSKRVLALLVEVGECANEWRGFKYWSKDREPRLRKARAPYMDLDDADFYNPLLEEYVDGLHFVLELGIVLGFETVKPMYTFGFGSVDSEPLGWFTSIYGCINDLREFPTEPNYRDLLDDYFGLGRALGFTWDEIEAAYFSKMAINHDRQNNGY